MAFWDQIGQVLAPAVVALVSYGGLSVASLIKAKRDKERKSDPERLRRTDVKIHGIIERCGEGLGAMRAHVNLRKNGENYADDSEVWRYSRAYEWVRLGTSYQSDEPFYKNVLTSSVPCEMKLVTEDGPSWRAVNTLTRGKFRWLCEQAGVKSVARCAIKKGKMIIGFVGVDFDTIDEPPDKCQAICEAAFEIGQILANA